MQGKTAKILTLCLLILCTTQATKAAAYPDTFACDTTPTIDFPSTVTVGTTRFVMAGCDDIKSVPGDFVTMFIAEGDAATSHVLNISDYEVTDLGVEWVSPVTDANGNVWASVYIDPDLIDCNSTGVPYSIHTHWDSQTALQSFKAVCPTIEFEYHRIEVPNWEALRVTAAVTDNRGYAMRNIPCTASVVDINSYDGYIVIKQEKLESTTDTAGKVRYEFGTGFLHDLLQGYNYTVVVNCLGGDGNFVFTVEEINDENLRNPVYFTIIFLSDNIIPIVFALFIAAAAIGAIYYIAKRDN